MAENFFGITDTGRVRDNNEDAFIAKKVMNNRFIIACAIDGVGGYSGGEIAAEIARESIFENFAKPSGNLIEAMKASFILANQKIFAEKLQNKEHSKMACVLTLAVVDVQNNQFHYAHVGDTRLYLLRDHSLVKVTKDHSFVGFLEDSGRLDENAAMKHLKRNEINKALGFGREIESQDDYIETGSSPFLPGDMLLLCSDGLTDMVNKESITSIVTNSSSLEEKATQLVEMANKNGGRDNITVVLVQNDAASSWQATPSVGSLHEAQKKNLKPTDEPASNNNNPAPAKTENKPDHKLSVKSQSNPQINKILAFLCIFFLATSAFLLWRNIKQKAFADTPESVKTDTIRTSEEIKLQEAINTLKGDTLVLSDSTFNKPILLSDTLTIHQDSLFILARGKIVIQGDSLFKGPAIALSPDSRFILLDGVQFENFDIAVSAQNDALYLRNVQFVNCKWPVQNYFMFPDKQYVTGRLAGSYFFRTDSLNTQNR